LIIVIIDQDALGCAFGVVELPAFERPQECCEPQRSQKERCRNEKK
jgi:hypothetical protein